VASAAGCSPASQPLSEPSARESWLASTALALSMLRWKSARWSWKDPYFVIKLALLSVVRLICCIVDLASLLSRMWPGTRR